MLYQHLGVWDEVLSWSPDSAVREFPKQATRRRGRAGAARGPAGESDTVSTAFLPQYAAESLGGPMLGLGAARVEWSRR